MKALLFNSWDYEYDTLEKMTGEQLESLCQENPDNTRMYPDLKSFQDAFNDYEVSDEDFLFFVE